MRSEFRVGFGYDSHRFKEGRKLVLGGITIPHTKGLDGHSDADAVLHAIIDALLGAAALGDIGAHFPDTDERFKDVSSDSLLIEAVLLVRARGYEPVNVDVTVIAEEPKLRPYVDPMRTRIAEVLGVDVDAISVKGKTSEHMGPAGRGEGIEVHAVALLQRG
ncbi:MAG: 2-C-methyl-D-erythritol 2,4-cyclodiphosphate synthase [Gemmatimonadetes bacterium]|nr:2-C-methyl-D-erythritol 2,4-cyclodiphosphate synthase [Gemmatimonadota bacterium]